MIHMRKTLSLAGMILVVCSASAWAELRVGATVTDVTPDQFPVLVNGGMTSRSVDTVHTRVNARTLVLDDGHERIGFSVVDSCMLPKDLLDDVKALVASQHGIRADRIMISATHTHTAPSSMGALGTDADENYVVFVREKLVQSFADAAQNLTPAQVGWGVGQAAEYTALRRWIRRPDRLALDPFGNPTVRANMHAGRILDDVTGESGPKDPELSLISFQTLDGRPLAVIANFSMHYFGDKALGADYFGLFSEGLKARLAGADREGLPPFVGMMSHGCSGDIWRRDYHTYDPQAKDWTIDEYTEGLLNIALQVYEGITHQADADLAMAEARLPLNYRVPDAQRLQWAQGVVSEMQGQLPKTQPEVYAREQVLLHELQSTEVVVQGIRIGEIGIATTPNETYALTGLKIKLNSPLANTMVIELANGGDGYIPPPEQHHLGGYNTWAARSAGLEVEAEPKIAAAAIHLLEEVSQKASVPYHTPQGPATTAILDLNPLAYWRMEEMAGPLAEDSSPHRNHASYEPGVVFFLEGPLSEQFTQGSHLNRAAHFAGGRMLARLNSVSDDYTVSLWVWNGMPVDARPVTGWLFSRGRAFTPEAVGEHLGLGGQEHHPGRLIFSSRGEVTAGKTELKRWDWNHVVLVRRGEQVQVFLNGNPTPEITAPAAKLSPNDFFFGGRGEREASWEGRLDEIAVFDRALTAEERARLSVK